MTRRDRDTLIKGKTTSANKIPYWLWIVIAKALGIKLEPNEKPWVSAVFHILTFGSAVGESQLLLVDFHVFFCKLLLWTDFCCAALFSTNGWYCLYAVMSRHTRKDILDGVVSIMVMTFFCGLGVYSHRLAYRLFVHPKFLDMLRLHSKTVMKLNSAFLLFVILSSFVVVLNVATVDYSYSFRPNATLGPNYDTGDGEPPAPVPVSNATAGVNPCQTVEIRVEICQVYWATQVLFSLLFLVWNLLVAVVLVSVARTQTINIRRFLRELEQDAFLLDRSLQASYGVSKPLKDDLKNFVWMDDDHLAEMFGEEKENGGAAGTAEPPRRPSAASAQFNDLRLSLGEGDTVQTVQPAGQADSSNTFQRLESVLESAEAAVVPHIMSEQEIMHKYWKISMSVRLASVALQRWMSSIVGMISAWSAIRMVYWLSHSPTWYGVFMFIVPLLLLPLLASSYAEVNYEGVKVIQVGYRCKPPMTL